MWSMCYNVKMKHSYPRITLHECATHEWKLISNENVLPLYLSSAQASRCKKTELCFDPFCDENFPSMNQRYYKMLFCIITTDLINLICTLEILT